jgi:hypothetical protein
VPEKFLQADEKTIAEDSSFSNIFLDGRRHDWSNRFESDIMHSEMIHNFYGLFKNAQMQGVLFVRRNQDWRA